VTPSPELLRGSIVPLVTPYREGQVDLEAFEASVHRQAEAGSHGIVVTGTTGEPTSLSSDERVQLYGHAVAAAAGRLTVIAATGGANHDEAVRVAARAQEAGVDAVLSVCPPFVKPSQRGLVEHFSAVAATTTLPFLIYNIPGRSATGVLPETIERVRDQAGNLIGVKHAAPDLDFVTEVLLRLGDDFRVFCGIESLSYPFLVMGAAGLMSAVGNLFPEKLVTLCEAVEVGDHSMALAIHRELFRVNQAIFFDTNPVPLKAMLAEMGLGRADVRLPLTGLDQTTRQRVLDALSSVKVAAVIPAVQVRD
jgi:4-hydroxy-tetrahydrodipicolinate synthase